MKLFRTCLLLLLSLLLPVQAALAAGAAGCLRHVSQGLLTSAVAMPAAAEDVVAQDHSACAQHTVGVKGATKAAADGHVADADAGCNSCGLCCLAPAMPSQGPLLQATHLQQAQGATSGAAVQSTVVRTLDRPPRASAAAR